MELLSPVVSTHWLHKQLEEGTTHNIVILDATWFPDKDAMADFNREHIQVACYFNPFQGTKQSSLYPRPLPDPQTFEMSARGATVCNNSHVIIYDSYPGRSGFFLSGRVYLMFKLFGHNRVSVLDGGLEKWKTDGFPVTDMCMRKMAGDFTGNLNDKWRVQYDDMVSNLTTMKFQVLDSRAPHLYLGNPNDPKSGHYPRAVNIPYSSLFSEQSNDLKKVEELRKVFSDAGIHLDKPIVTMCFAGISSCSLTLAAQLCGATHAYIYFEGFSEWKGKADEKHIQQG